MHALVQILLILVSYILLNTFLRALISTYRDRVGASRMISETIDNAGFLGIIAWMLLPILAILLFVNSVGYNVGNIINIIQLTLVNKVERLKNGVA